uniref:competence protein CoiA family protein n=1 Tax=Cyclobacterium roseum TaxID=2666137 RepID=UPI0037445B87
MGISCDFYILVCLDFLSVTGSNQKETMKFAIVNGTKAEATKGFKGICPSCGAELIAKCGERKINHWTHKASRNCDPWWEQETE